MVTFVLWVVTTMLLGFGLLIAVYAPQFIAIVSVIAVIQLLVSQWAGGVDHVSGAELSAR